MAKDKSEGSSTRKRQEVKSTFPTPWKPALGETLEGTYHGFNMVANSARGDEFKSHKIKPDGKDEFMGVSGALLDQKMERIPKGTYVWITYTGELKTNNGTAKEFTVECEEGTKLLSEDEIDGVITPA